MELQPIRDEHERTVAKWLSEPANYQWLHFGNGVQQLNALSLKMMLAKIHVHHLRLFTDSAGNPAGIVALSDINRVFQTATLWYVLGDKKCAGKGYTTQAVKLMLAESFLVLELNSVYAWVVDENIASIRILENSGFTPTGRHRMAHKIDQRYYDVLFYDMLAHEFKPEKKEKNDVAHT